MRELSIVQWLNEIDSVQHSFSVVYFVEHITLKDFAAHLIPAVTMDLGKVEVVTFFCSERINM